jgi:hypothetical protein
VTGHEMLVAGITISPLKWTVIHRDRPDRRDDRRVAGPLARPSACAAMGCGQPHWWRGIAATREVAQRSLTP